MPRSHSLVATSKRSLPVACNSSTFRGFERALKWSCGFLQSEIHLFLDISSPSGLCSLPLFSPPQCFSVAHSNPSSWYWSGGSRPGYLSAKESLLSNALEPHKGIGFSKNFPIQATVSSSPPCLSSEACFLWHLRNQLGRHSPPSQASRRHLLVTVPRKCFNTFPLCSHFPSTHTYSEVSYGRGCY